MASALEQVVLAAIQEEYRRAPPRWWKVDEGLSEEEQQALEAECTTPSEFDPDNTRLRMWTAWKKGHRRAVLRACSEGRVFVILDRGMTEETVPWEWWGRILRLFHSGSGNRKGFCIYFFAVHRPRRFPRSIRTPITPESINGGYTYPCQKEMILIYRAEDATRVLLHELQHAVCLDHVDQGVDRVEAETEAWAELWYVALQSRGDRTTFREGLRRQSAWILGQNAMVRRWIGNRRDFPWRYTIGKEEVWRRWGILSEEEDEPVRSLRLTAPPLGRDVHGME